MPSEYIIYCDESTARGEYYSNFYGGLIIAAHRQESLTNKLNATKIAHNLFGEIKWSKVTERYLPKYIAMVDALFEEIANGNIKIRIMFSQNIHVAQNLSAEHKEKKFEILYYQFIKRAFGLLQAPPNEWPMKLRIYLDNLPETRIRMREFKKYLLAMPVTRDFQYHELILKAEDIAEVDSKEHVLLQCLDILLGAAQFRLNDLHREKIPGTLRRAERTKAKDKLYQHIRKRISVVMGVNFNYGLQYSLNGDISTLWNSSYRHWLFKAKGAITDTSNSKSKKKKPPS